MKTVISNKKSHVTMTSLLHTMWTLTAIPDKPYLHSSC